MDTRTLLEKDQERFQTRLAQADTPEQTVTEIEEEMNRILLQYNESCTDERLSQAALHAMKTARASAALVNSGGEIRVYERTPSGSSGKSSGSAALSKPFFGPLAAGAACIAVGILLYAMAPESIHSFAAALLIVGGIVLFWAGTRFGAGKAVPLKRDQIFESKPDPEKIYRHLHTLLTAGIPDEELQLLRGLLETAYTQDDRDAGDASISDIRFYLHKHGIDVVDYNVETAKWFNLMPSKGQGTLCPALVREGTVLIKGTAAAGR